MTKLADGKTNYESAVTDIVSLDQTPEVFKRLQTDKSQIKILVKPDKK